MRSCDLRLLQTFWHVILLWSKFTKGPYGPFGTKPAKASVFIGVTIILKGYAFAGISMPARASAFNSPSAFTTVYRQLNVDALVGIAVPATAPAFNSQDTLRNAGALAGLALKGPQSLYETCS